MMSADPFDVAVLLFGAVFGLLLLAAVLRDVWRLWRRKRQAERTQ